MTRDEIVSGARDVIQNGSKSFRAASRLFQPVVRERAWMLYCWCRHCDDVCDGQVHGFGQSMRGNIAELRDKTRQAVEGRPSGELPFQALAQLLFECPIPERFIEDHLRGFELDEAGWFPRSEKELAVYCYHVAGAVGCMMAVLMGVPADDETTLNAAADLGIAFQLSNIARDVREDAEAGRCYLPQNWLDELKVDRAKLFAPGNEMALQAMIVRLIDDVVIYETSARRGVPKLHFRSRLAVLSALRIYGAIGRQVRRLGGAAWKQRVSVGKLRKLALVVPSFIEAVAARPT